MKLLTLLFFLFTGNILSAEVAFTPNKDRQPFIKEYIPFLDNILWPDKNKSDPYNHYFSLSFSPFFFRASDNGNGTQIDNLFFFNLSYGQYNSLLRMPGRFIIDMGGIFGRGYMANEINKEDINFVYLGMMQEFIFTFKWFYITAGIGFYIRNAKEDRINSRFLFGQKVGIGTVFNDKFDIELFFRHFSNGDLQMPNNGFNMIGLQLGIRI